MATMELSAGFLPGYMSRILDRTDFNNQVGRLTYPGDIYAVPTYASVYGLFVSVISGVGNSWYTTTTINIMKGTVPADFTTLTAYSSRSADILMSYNPYNNAAVTVNSTSNPAIITGNVAATAAGVATWFWLTTRKIGSGAPTDTLVHQMIGTVGMSGTGSDLEINNTTVVSGTVYRISNLRINFPTTFNIV